MSISSGLDLSQVEMVPGVRNFIEAVDIREGDRVFLLADTRSDVPSLQAVCTVLKAIGARPTVMVMEHLSRFDEVPDGVLEPAKESDCLVLVWPVFLTRALDRVRRPRTATSDVDPSAGVPEQPKLVYLECAPGCSRRSTPGSPTRFSGPLRRR